MPVNQCLPVQLFAQANNRTADMISVTYISIGGSDSDVLGKKKKKSLYNMDGIFLTLFTMFTLQALWWHTGGVGHMAYCLSAVGSGLRPKALKGDALIRCIRSEWVNCSGGHASASDKFCATTAVKKGNTTN